jgi:hypothetical protein
VPKYKSLRAAEPKTALSETVDFNKTLTAVKDAVGVEGGQEDHRPRCHVHAGPRLTTASERGLGGGGRKGSTSL